MGNRLFVGNLPWGATEQDLRDHIGEDATNVRIIIDRDTGRSKGFAFVDMTTDQAAAEAIQRLDGMDFGGRPLRVNEATERERRPSSGGGNGGGYGPSGGGGRGPSRGQRGGGHRRDKLSDDGW